MSFNLGNKLKELRKKRDLTQEQMAEFFGVSSQAVSKWETNASYPDISLLPIIANFFAVTVDELLGIETELVTKKTEEIRKTAAELNKSGKYAEAISLTRTALVQYPGNEGIMYELAWALTGEIKNRPENLDEAILIYLKLLEISNNTALKAKVTRDLMYRYYTKGDETTAYNYAKQLPSFDVCLEYNLGRSNLLHGKELAEYLISNIDRFGYAMKECLEYFTNTNIISEKDMPSMTPDEAKHKIELLKEIIR